jgi:hypothetical protein
MSAESMHAFLSRIPPEVYAAVATGRMVWLEPGEAPPTPLEAGMVVGWIYPEGRLTFQFADKPLAQQLRGMLEHFDVSTRREYGAFVEAAMVALADRGRKPSPEQARAFELFNAEVEAGRDPFAPKLAGVIARKLAVEPNTVRRWRDKWAEERERN